MFQEQQDEMKFFATQPLLLLYIPLFQELEFQEVFPSQLHNQTHYPLVQGNPYDLYKELFGDKSLLHNAFRNICASNLYAV